MEELVLPIVYLHHYWNKDKGNKLNDMDNDIIVIIMLKLEEYSRNIRKYVADIVSRKYFNFFF